MEHIKETANRLAHTMSQVRSIDSRPSSEETRCAACNGTGYVTLKKGLTECECAIERRVISRIPQRYRNASLADLKQSRVDFIAQWFASKPTEGLLVTGAVGCGKTYLAAAMIRSQILIRERSVRFERFADFYARIRETYRINTSEETIMEDLLRVKWLYLDDLGAGSLSDHERRATHDLLDRRWNMQTPTIITTNWTIEEIANRLDDRVADRLQAYVQLRLDGESRRGEPSPH